MGDPLVLKQLDESDPGSCPGSMPPVDRSRQEAGSSGQPQAARWQRAACSRQRHCFSHSRLLDQRKRQSRAAKDSSVPSVARLSQMVWARPAAFCPRLQTCLVFPKRAQPIRPEVSLGLSDKYVYGKFPRSSLVMPTNLRSFSIYSPSVAIGQTPPGGRCRC